MRPRRLSVQGGMIGLELDETSAQSKRSNYTSGQSKWMIGTSWNSMDNRRKINESLCCLIFYNRNGVNGHC